MARSGGPARLHDPRRLLGAAFVLDLTWSGVAGIALAASLAVTAVYHLGYDEFRGAALAGPLIGNTIVSVAYLLARNPVAPGLPHVAMHVAAVVHGMETAVQLPPHG